MSERAAHQGRPTSVEPLFSDSLRSSMRGAVHDVKGLTEGWAVPISTIEAPNGFGEEVWHIPQTETVLAWTIDGADIVSEMAGHRGKRTSSPHRAVNLQVRGEKQHYRSTGKVRFRHFYLTDALLGRVAEGLNTPSFTASALRTDLIMLDDIELWNRLEACGRRSSDRFDPPSRLEMEARAMLVGEQLVLRHHLAGCRPQAVDEPAPSHRVPDWRIRRAVERLESCLADDLGLAELAAEAGLSLSHFSTRFRNGTGLPPHRWVMRRRVERACEMLADPRRSVTEIAHALGFASSQHLATVFKKHMGATPSEYRIERLG